MQNFYGMKQNVQFPPIATRIQRGQVVYNTSRKPVTIKSKRIGLQTPSYNMTASTRKLNVFKPTKVHNARHRTRRNHRSRRH